MINMIEVFSAYIFAAKSMTQLFPPARAPP